MDRKTNDAPRRIAVLGGGMAALTAIYQLTNEKDWKDRYDITLFQTGWRLGGKGASGRDPENAYRIEEHGLHLWFGCYQNAFNLIQSCYNELDRETGAPLSSWKSAFEPATFVGLHENVNGESVYWPLHFPITDEDPGGDDKLPTVWDNVSRMIKILVERYLEAVVTYTFRPPANLDKAEQEFYVQFNEELTVYLRDLSRMFGIDVASASVKDGMELMETFLDEARKSGNYDILLSVSEEVRNWFWDKIEDVVYEYHGVRRMWVLFDLTIGTMTGVIKDRLQYRGLDVINDMDFREWISQYCLTPELTAWSAPIQAMYSLIFCGKNKHTFEAGTCLRCIFRVALNYKGAFYYRMQAGMGDTIFTPFYELLKRRGVKIKFFHKIQEVHLNEDKSEIESIRIQKQVELKSEEYQPLFDVNGLDCWPSHPLWDQLKDGDKVKESGVNFEHYSDNWEGATEFEWQAGRDFDHVLFGISLGAVPFVAKELVEANERWADMVKAVTTTPTQALQVWLKTDIAGTGWSLEKYGKPLVGNFAGRFDTYADLSNLLGREKWPEGEHADHAAYLCGMLEDHEAEELNKPGFFEKRKKEVREEVENFFKTYARQLWPKAGLNGAGFDWNMLADAQNRSGSERIDGQYYRANDEPTERYVLAVAGNSKFRIKAGDTGFGNLTICGDWIDNGFNAGCIEATVISGLQAARAINGNNDEIVGEYDTVDPEPKVLTP